MTDEPTALVEEAFRKIMKIARLTTAPARAPELCYGAAAVVKQLKTDAAKFGTEASAQQLQALRRKLESALTSPPPPTIERIVIRETLEVLGAENGLEEKPRR